MFLNISRISDFFSNIQTQTFRQLSETGKQSVSWNLVDKFYRIVIAHYNIINSSLKMKRDIYSGNKTQVSLNKLDISPRLKYELTCLITTLLKNLDNFDIDKLINQDSELIEEDKTIVKNAYYSLMKNIQLMSQLLDEPCFGREKIEEENENVN